MANKLNVFDWSNVYSAKNAEEADSLLNPEIVLMFNESFSQLRSKSPRVTHHHVSISGTSMQITK